MNTRTRKTVLDEEISKLTTIAGDLKIQIVTLTQDVGYFTEANTQTRVKTESLLKDIDNLNKCINKIEEEIKTIRQTLKDDYVTNEKFAPIQMLNYGFVALALTIIITALIGMVVTK